jgi:hypothetical protein
MIFGFSKYPQWISFQVRNWQGKAGWFSGTAGIVDTMAIAIIYFENRGSPHYLDGVFAE